jgi:PelA/Pel-15E family pectate lyase
MPQPLRNSLIQQLVLICLIVGLLCLLGDWWNAYELQVDEGFNLAKAALVADGHHLYSEIWSDQPPLLTYVLSLVHRSFPFSLAAARTTILIFSLLLATSLFRVVARFEGRFAAWASVLILLSTRLFQQLSVSVMIGLPAVALAMLAIDLATIGKGKSRILPLLAGLIFGAALLTKLFAAIVLPAAIAAFWFMKQRDEPSSPRTTAWRLVWFCGGMGLAAILVLARIRDIPIDQLIATHLSARSLADYSDLGGVGRLFRILVKNAPFASFSTLVFILLAAYRRPPLGSLVIPAIWFVSGTVLLSTHHPLWLHQSLILIPPMSWLGGAGFQTLFRSIRPLRLWQRLTRNPHRRIALALVVLMAVGGTMAVTRMVKNLRKVHSYFSDRPDLSEQMVRLDAAILMQGAGTLLTDKPILAYHGHRLVPPELAVWSEKRIKADRINEEDILQQVAAHSGSPVLFARFSYDRSLLDRIAALRDEIKTGFERQNNIHLFLPKTEPSALEADLIARLPALLDGGVGGLFRMSDGRLLRFDRPASTTPLEPDSVVARPPGSAQELGACLTAAARATSSKALLIHALDIGLALYCTQTQGGGWENHAVATANCGGRRFVRLPDRHATFDDGTMASILYFAFDLSDLISERGLTPPPWLDDMIDKALSFILKAQSKDGSWPQQYQGHGYHQLATLNDDVTTGLIRVLLVSHARLGRPELLASAGRGGDFLLKVQDLGQTPAFAQQYDSFRPAPARRFEPVGYSSLETAYAINALLDLYLSTGDERYRRGAEKAAAWLDAVRITSTTWARLYEPGSNRPVYGQRDGTITYDFADLPEKEQKTYRWSGGRDTFPDIGIALDRVAALGEGRDAVQSYDAHLLRKALLSATPTARVWLDPEQARQDPGAHASTRAFVQYCAGRLSTATNAPAEPSILSP